MEGSLALIQILFPQYSDLLKEGNLQVEHFEQFLREQLPRGVKMVRAIDNIFLAFQQQYSTLILKRPSSSTLSHAFLLKANDQIEKFFRILEQESKKARSQIIDHWLADFDLVALRLTFRQKLQDLLPLLTQKFFSNQNCYSNPYLTSISQLLSRLLELYSFLNQAFVTIGSKASIRNSCILEPILEGEELNSSSVEKLYFAVGKKFRLDIEEIVAKRFRVGVDYRDTLLGRINVILKETEIREGPEIQMLLDIVFRREKARISQAVYVALQPTFNSVPSEPATKQFEKEFDALRKGLNRLKNNSHYIDIIRIDFSEKYKMQLTQMRNLYYLAALENYLQEVTTWLNRLRALQTNIIFQAQKWSTGISELFNSKLQQLSFLPIEEQSIPLLMDNWFFELEQALVGETPSRLDSLQSTTYEMGGRRGVQDPKKTTNSSQEDFRRMKQIRDQQDVVRKQKEEAMRRKRKQEEEERKRRDEEEREKKGEERKKREEDRKIKEEQRKSKEEEKIRELEKRKKEEEEEKKQKDEIAKREREEKLRKYDEQKAEREKLLKDQKDKQEAEKKAKIMQESKEKEERERRVKEERELKEQKERDERERKTKEEREKKEKEEKEKERRAKEEREQKQKEERERLENQRKEDEERQRKLKELEEKKEKEERERKQKIKREEEQRERIEKEETDKKERVKKEEAEKLKKEELERVEKERREREEKERRDQEAKEKKEREEREKTELEKIKREEKERKEKEAKEKKEREEAEKREKEEKIAREREQKAMKEKQEKQKKEKEQKAERERQRFQKEQREKQKFEQAERERQKVGKAEREKKEKLENERKQKERIQKQKQLERKRKGEVAKEQKKGGIKGKKEDGKKSLGLNYDMTDELDDAAEALQDEYADDFEEEQFQDLSYPQGPHIAPKDLIDQDGLKAFNEYLKGTSYARKNKLNIEIFNIFEHYFDLFAELIQTGKLYIFDGIAKAVIKLAQSLSDERCDEDDLRSQISVIKEEIYLNYEENTQLSQIDPRMSLIFPFSFKNKLGIQLIEVVPAEEQIIIILEKQIEEKERNLYDSIIEGFLHIFEIQGQPEVHGILLEAETKMILQTYQGELPAMLLIFAMHYQKTWTEEIMINQYTIERFFYASHVLSGLENIYSNQDQLEKLNQFFDRITKLYEKNDKIRIKKAVVQHSLDIQEALQGISQSMKIEFIQAKIPTLLGLIQLVIPPEEQEEEVRSLSVFLQMTRTTPKPTLNYYAIYRDEIDQQEIFLLLNSILDDDFDDKFETHLYLDFSRHSAISDQAEHLLPLWAHTILKRKLAPIQAMRALVFSMAPIYVAFKEQQ